MASGRIKLSDVAGAAGLSITQVSRALAGYADVAAATRERVAGIARTMGYRPSARARALASGRELAPRCTLVSLGFVPESIVLSSYGPVLPGVMTRAAELGLQIHLETVPHGVPPAEALRRLAAEDRADGVIVLTFLRLTPEDVQPLVEAGLPFVLVNRHFRHVAGTAAHLVNQVVPDWIGGTRDAVERLAALGHRSVVGLFSSRETSTLLDHEQGWREGVARCGLDPALAPVVRYPMEGPGDVDNRQGHLVGRRLLTEGLPGSGARPTAVVAFNDFCAHGVLQAARELGVAVPGTLSVIGFDDSIARFTFPRLCSYNPEFHLLGVHAAELLGTLLRGDGDNGVRGGNGEGNGEVGPAPARQVTVPLRFVCRESCGPAPG